jgi:hypothetical protein
MNKLTICFVISLLALPVENCIAGETPGNSDKRADDPTGETATVFIIRDHAEPTYWPADILLDKKLVVTLQQQYYTKILVTPGKRKFAAKWPYGSQQEEAYLTLNVSQGETYYIELTGVSIGSVLAGNSILTNDRLRHSDLNRVKPELGEKLLSACCILRNAIHAQY